MGMTASRIGSAVMRTSPGSGR